MFDLKKALTEIEDCFKTSCKCCDLHRECSSTKLYLEVDNNLNSIERKNSVNKRVPQYTFAKSFVQPLLLCRFMFT